MGTIYLNILEWGLGIGDWGLGIGDWGLGIGPNPQSPIHNPQSPIPIVILNKKNKFENFKFFQINFSIFKNNFILNIYN